MKKWGGLFVVVVAAIVLEVISAIQYYHMRDVLERELQARAQTELTLKTFITKCVVEYTERSLKSHIREIRSNLDNPDSLSDILTWFIRFHPSRRGAGVAFKPYYYPQKGKLFEPYALRNDTDGIENLQIAGKNFDYTRDGFYRDIMRKKTAGWVGPYDDKFLYQRLITYAVPITEPLSGDTVAVLGIDTDTRHLSEAMNMHHLYSSSFTLLLTEEGVLIAGPTDPSLAQDVERVVQVINDSTAQKRFSDNGNTTIADFRDATNGDKGYVFCANFQGQPHWQIATVYYDDEVYGALREQRVYMLLLMVAAFVVLGFIVWRFFRNDLKLQTTELQQERIGSELRIAHNIQAKMLPNVYPPFPERKDIDVYGLLVPAREVGGDLFDFFIRDEKLFFCIGDVSGKGVPAAMVMAVTHSLFRSASAHDSNPSRILHNLNETLCQGNDSNMFVTLFIGVLNLPSGRLRYCNAGHDKPIIVGGGTAKSIEATAHLPLGVFSDTRYDSEECMLQAGSTLFLFTDGLTEAKDLEHQQFRLQRVMDMLRSRDWESACQLVTDMEQAVRTFVGDAEQSDDLTLLSIRYTPQQCHETLSEELTISSNVHQVPEMNQFVKSVLNRLNVPASLARQLRLAVEEAVVNVMNYAYPAGSEGNICLQINSSGQHLNFVIIDSGIPFDPTEQKKADTTLSAEDRPIGGLGILLVRTLMDTINYERIDNKNILTLTKKLTD